MVFLASWKRDRTLLLPPVYAPEVVFLEMQNNLFFITNKLKLVLQTFQKERIPGRERHD
jgi:hypothetical protein